MEKNRADNAPVTRAVTDSVKNIQRDTVKTFANYYTFNNSLDTEQNIRAGWTDTFSIANRRFRFSSNSEQALIIEYYDAGAWQINLYGGNFTMWDFGLADVNGDGYNDLVIGHKMGMSVNFYNPVANLFDTVTWEMMGLDTLLEQKRLVHYNWYSDIARSIVSELYTFKGIKPYYYFILRFERGKTSGPYKPVDEFIGLWKCTNGDEDIDKAELIRKIKLHHGEYAEDYDFRKFWIENYKALLNDY